MTIISYFLAFIGASMSTWGSQTRGEWSRSMAIIGGWLWLGGIILVCIQAGVLKGLLTLVLTFIFASICRRIFPRKI